MSFKDVDVSKITRRLNETFKAVSYEELEEKLQDAFKDVDVSEITRRLNEKFKVMSEKFEMEQKAMKPSKKQLQQKINI